MPTSSANYTDPAAHLADERQRLHELEQRIAACPPERHGEIAHLDRVREAELTRQNIARRENIQMTHSSQGGASK